MKTFLNVVADYWVAPAVVLLCWLAVTYGY